MKEVFSGIANHASGYEEDYLNVLEGDFEFLGISSLLPKELRCSCFAADYGTECFQERGKEDTQECTHRGNDWICRPPKFRFTITVETEKVK